MSACTKTEELEELDRELTHDPGNDLDEDGVPVWFGDEEDDTAGIAARFDVAAFLAAQEEQTMTDGEGVLADANGTDR